MKKNHVIIVFFSLCVLVMLWIMISDPDTSVKDKSQSDDEAAVAALFGSPEGNTKSKRQGGNSFFSDSSFMKTGIGDGSIDEESSDLVAKNTAEPDILEPVNPNNPINPQTGQPYADSAMEKFATLRKKFPNNDLIPTTKTPEQKTQDAEKQKRMFALQSMVVQNNASAEEVNEYYDLQMKSYKDRKELLGYVFENMADKMSDDIKSQYEKVQEMNNTQLADLENKRKRSLESAK